MRVFSLIPLIALTAFAQDPWAPVQEALRDQRAAGRFLVAGAGIDLGQQWILKDEVVSAIQVSQLGQKMLTGTASQQLKTLLQGPGWALFAPDGRRLAEGSGTPEPARIREEMAKAGWTWIRDDLKAHLARRPEDGQAWVELAIDLTRQVQQGWVSGTDQNIPMVPERRKAFLAELEAAMAGLAKVPELEQAWLQAPRQSLVFVTLFLGMSEFRKDPQVKPLLDRIAAPFMELARRDPENGRIWDFFFSLRVPDETTTFRESFELMEQLGGVPGRPWPPLRSQSDVLTGLLQDREVTLQRAEQWLAANLAPDLARRLGRGHVLDALKVWGDLRFVALVHLGRAEEARRSLEDLRSMAGSQWPQVAEAFRGHVFLKPGESGEEPLLTAVQQQAVHTLLNQPPLPDRPFLPLQPLRLAMVGPADPLVWGKLQADPLMDPWDPSELSWKPLTKAESERLAGHRGWVLLKGEERLASGGGLPTAAALDVVLRQHGRPRLEAMDAYLKAHPERLDARRERVSQLSVRMPHPRLEPRLVEDLEALAASFNVPPISDASAWKPTAKRVCERLGERIRHWPFHDEAWQAYVDWSALAPGATRLGTLLEGLDAWPRLRGNLLPGSLPTAVSLAVARKLGAAGRWEELRGWGDALWRKGLQAWLRHSASIPLSDKGSSAFDRNLGDVRQLLSWHGKALRQLGKTTEGETLRQELEVLRTGLGTALSQPPVE